MIYISGPLTNADPLQQQANIDRALHFYKLCVMDRALAWCPHLSAYVPGAFDMDWKTWIHYDLAIIERGSIVTCMFMMPGWEYSRGAKMELAVALKRELPVFTSLQAAIDHYHATYGPLPL